MITRPTTAAVISGIGWSNGMASQLSLPNMLMLRPRGYARARPSGLRTKSRRYLLRDDLLEQPGIGHPEGERAGVHALLGQRGVARGIEGWAVIARRFDPGGEALRRHGLHVEMHSREPIAAVVARQAEER